MSIDRVIAGALYDFLAYLTTRDEPLKLGAKEPTPPALEALEDWARKRNLSLDQARATDWHQDEYSGLKMKYFVLSPTKMDAYGEASRAAIITYANAIYATNETLARDLLCWVGSIPTKSGG